MRWIFLDTETTGMNTQDRIIELGAVEVIDRKFTNRNLHFYFNVPVNIHPDALKIHGITKAFLSDKPIFAEYAQQILDYIAGAEVIIHNAPFDVRFLNYELSMLESCNIALESHCTIIDSLALARRMHPNVSNSLDSLCTRYGINTADRSLHSALIDAKLLASVYLGMTGGQIELISGKNNNSIRVPYGNYKEDDQELSDLANSAIVLAKRDHDLYKQEKSPLLFEEDDALVEVM